MSRRSVVTLTSALGIALAFSSLPAPAVADQPWLQLLSGSRPSNLKVASEETEVQELKTAKEPSISSFAGRVKVEGELIACLGTGTFASFCAPPAIETAAQLQEALEGPYGAGEVEVTGGPVGGAPFLITTPGRWVAPVVVEPIPFAEFGDIGSAETVVKSEGVGRLTSTLTNLGNAPLDAAVTPLEITDELPEGVLAYGVQAEAGGQGSAGEVDCAIEAADLVHCSFEEELPSYEAIELEVLVALPPGTSGGDTGLVSVSGADAEPTEATQALHLSDDKVPFGLEHFSMRAEAEGGAEAAAAGSHPFQLTTTIAANSGVQSGADRRNARVAQPALPRNLRFTLPAGFVGDATAVPTCELAVFLQQTNFGGAALVNACPPESAIGVSSVTVIEGNTFGLVRLAVPVFNLPPGLGEPARFGLMVAGVPVVIGTSVDPSEEYKITAEVSNIPQVAQFLSSTTTIWGVPGAAAHDGERGWRCAYFLGEEFPGDCAPPTDRNEAPFLRLPTQCSSPLVYEAAFEPWNVPRGAVVDRAADEGERALRSCNGVPFEPRISSTFTSRLAENPSGQEFGLFQGKAGFGNKSEDTPEAQAKHALVSLPEGVTLNPSAAEGLAVCSESELARERFDSAPGEGCPQASKVGSLEAVTPLIEERLRGALYVAEPYRNPFGSLLALYMVLRSPERGVLVVQPLELEPDERTGQLLAVADDAPPLPYTSLRLTLREGARAPLVTPPRCGDFETAASFVPWSAGDPDNPLKEEIVESHADFEITRGVDGGPCPWGGVPPFGPGFSAGTLNNQAGSASPFVMRLTRSDGDQDMTRFSAVLPPGVLGKIAGLSRCPETAIAAAAARSGKRELAAPSCPASSRIGRTLAGAGVGSVLTYVPGSLYLAGPYNGDPLSVVAITPAVAGPFDVGTVVVREALRLNPTTAQVEVDGRASDPIPHILAGIPLKLRDLQVYVDLPDFTRNATSCDPSQTLATLWGGFADVFDATDDVPVGLSDRYQAAGCRALGFKPKLAIKLRGGVRRGANPALRAHVVPRLDDANFARAVVTLPRSAFLDQAHIRTVCTRVQFAAGPGHGALCPKGAIYGRARAWSPLLDEPAEGPVFLRSSDNRLPDLVVALKGPPSAPVDVELSARIDSIRGGIRTTFAGIPDVPVSRFILDMQGGKKGLIVNSRHLCHKPKRNRAIANLKAQNASLSRTRPVVRADRCQKRRNGKRARLSGAVAVRP